MKRTLALFLCMLLLAGAGMGLVFAALQEQRDNVGFIEVTAEGDRAALAGLVVTTRNDYDNHLQWDTVTRFDAGDAVSDTEFLYSWEALHDDIPKSFFGVSLDIEIPSWLTSDTITTDWFGMEEAYAELAADTPPGEEGERSVLLSDYHEVYPLSVWLDFPGYYGGVTADEADDRDEDTSDDGWDERGNALVIRDYFAIPVLPHERYTIGVGKDNRGNIHTTHLSSGTDNYHIETVGVMTDDAYYFTFRPYTQGGKAVDLSLLPDGYGLFRVGYEQVHDDHGALRSQVDGFGIEMVYPLDPENRLLHLALDDAGEQLLLYEAQGDSCVLTVVELDGMRELQRIELGTYWEEGSWTAVWEEDGFHSLLHDSVLTVITQGADGRWTKALAADIEDTDLYQRLNLDFRMAFDGERLAAVGYADVYRNCNVMLSVVDADGVQYTGWWQCSLAAGDSDDTTHYRCHPRNREALAAAWGTE